jgi:hypothetical protein
MFFHKSEHFNGAFFIFWWNKKFYRIGPSRSLHFTTIFIVAKKWGGVSEAENAEKNEEISMPHQILPITIFGYTIFKKIPRDSRILW